MDSVDAIAVQAPAADLAEEVQTRSATGAAAKLASYDGPNIVAALLKLSPGFAQDVLGALPDEARERVLAAAPEEIARQWQRNAFYEKDAVGRMMEPVVGSYPGEQTIAETVERLRELVKTKFITYIYVTDAEHRLQGVVTMRDLLLGRPEQRLDDVMIKNVFALSASTPLDEAMKQVLDRHYPVYPVIDHDRRLIGLVRGQSMFEARAIEITMQAGNMVGVSVEERLGTPWKQAFKMRHGWLQLNLGTAFLAAAVVGFYQDTIDRLVILALFLPVLAGQSGNTGCQALAVTLRGMTLGELKPGTGKPLVKKEALLGCLNGAGVGLAAAIGMYIIAAGQANDHPIMLSVVVFLAMIGSCVASGLSGALVPLGLKRLGFDPATASSIFLTTATDVVSMGMLLGLATVLIW